MVIVQLLKSNGRVSILKSDPSKNVTEKKFKVRNSTDAETFNNIIIAMKLHLNLLRRENSKVLSVLN